MSAPDGGWEAIEWVDDMPHPDNPRVSGPCDGDTAVPTPDDRQAGDQW